MSIGLILLSWVEYGILGLMLGLSVWSVAIMLERRRFLYQEKTLETSARIRELILAHKWTELFQYTGGGENFVARSIHQLMVLFKNKNYQPDDKLIESMDRTYRSFVSSQKSKIETGLSHLATLGANAPFIGLFGTVLGIIQAFAALGFESSGTSSVMSGISRSLFATAAGLFVAIPAVVAFNFFGKKIKEIYSENDSLKDLLVSHILVESSRGGGK